MGIIPPYYTMCLSSQIADQKIQISTTMVYEYTLKKDFRAHLDWGEGRGSGGE